MKLIRSLITLSILKTAISKRELLNFLSSLSVEVPPPSYYSSRQQRLSFVHRQARKFVSHQLTQVSKIGKSCYSRTKTRSALNLFSLNLNDLKNTFSKINVDAPENDNEVLPTWAKALLSYEATKSNSSQKVNSNFTEVVSSDKQRSSSFPLASLINVEALLMASGQIQNESESDKTTALLLDMLSDTRSVANSANSTSMLKKAQNDLSLDSFVSNLQQNVLDIQPGTMSLNAYDKILNQATQSLEKFIIDAAMSLSPERIQSLIVSVARSLSVDQNADSLKSTIDRIVAVAESLAKEQGMDVSEAAAQARATTKYTAEFLRVANGVLLSGYVRGTSRIIDKRNEELAKEMKINLNDADNTKPLFSNYKSVQCIPDVDFNHVVKYGAKMAKLSGGIYQNTMPTIDSLGHALVINRTVANVKYMVTDSIGYEIDFMPLESEFDDSPTLVRTITIRGFDASDDTVDREELINQICNAEAMPLDDNFEDILVHSGLLNTARRIYDDILPFIDGTGSMHKIVLNGHSIGGALSNLLLLLLTVDRGSDYVQNKVKRVYTYGSPPVARLKASFISSDSTYNCGILEAVGLPSNMVFSYVQPWDPIVRLFSGIDPMYPLIGDLGEDGVTLWASGPARTLRPITRAILEAWDKWPSFRDANRFKMEQQYMTMGVCHILMPDPGRYLADRLITVNINTYPVDEILRVSPNELYSALEEAFPLDVFSISLLPTSIRSFIHHFFPAYSEGMVDYVKNIMKKSSMKKNKLIVENEILALQRNQAAFELADQASKWINGAKRE